MSTPTQDRNFIDGRWAASRSEGTFATPGGQVFPESGDRDLVAAIAAARRGAEDWRRLSLPERQNHLLRLMGALDLKALATAMVEETGRPRGDVDHEIQAGFQEGRMAVARGSWSQVEVGDQDVLPQRLSLGVSGVVLDSPLPFAPAWVRLLSSWLSGNAAIWIPGRAGAQTSLVVARAGDQVPAGVLGLIHGDSLRLGAILARHPDVAAVAGVGSEALQEALQGASGALWMETPGMNPLIVLEDADVDRAVEAALIGGFRAQGQRCDSIRRCVVHRRVAGRFLSLLEEGALALEGKLRAPLLHEEVVKTVLARFKQAGDEIRVVPAPASEGLSPSVVSGVRPSMDLARHPLPAPVIAVIVVDSTEEAEFVANDVPQLHTACLYTSRVERALRSSREIKARSVVINEPPPEIGPAPWSRARSFFSSERWVTLASDRRGSH